MPRALSRWRKGLGAKVGAVLNTQPPPMAQLDDAIASAQEQERRLREQATAAIQAQLEAQARLDQAAEELVKLIGYTTQAVLMADEAAAASDASRADEHSSSARSFATRLVALEGEVADLERVAVGAAEATVRAKAALRAHAVSVRTDLLARAEALPSADQPGGVARAREATARQSAPVGPEVATPDQLRDQMAARHADAEPAAPAGDPEDRLTRIRAQLSRPQPEGAP